MKTILLIVNNRNGCPVRQLPNAEGGWGPQVPWCCHPEREARGGDRWCPDGPQQRADDDGTRPFPLGCPLQPFEALELLYARER